VVTDTNSSHAGGRHLLSALPSQAPSALPSAAPTSPTAAPTSPTVAGFGLFTVTSGACTTTSDATCFVSPNFPDNYGSNQNCNIHVAASEAVTLSVAAFTTEFCCDPLTVNGVRYRGTEGPDGVQVCVCVCDEPRSLRTVLSGERNPIAVLRLRTAIPPRMGMGIGASHTHLIPFRVGLVQVAAGETMTFTSDSILSHPGFKICGASSGGESLCVCHAVQATAPPEAPELSPKPA